MCKLFSMSEHKKKNQQQQKSIFETARKQKEGSACLSKMQSLTLGVN